MTQKTDLKVTKPENGVSPLAPNGRAADADAARRTHDQTQQEQQNETNAGVARATGVVAAGNIASRVLGLAREIALTNLFGASVQVDAFNIAVIVPKAFYDLLIGGHVNSALVPVLSDAASNEDDTDKRDFWQLVSVLMSFVSVVVAGLVFLLWWFAPQVVQVVAGDRSAETLVIAADLLRLTGIALWFLSLFAVLSGTLYALRSFTWPAFAGATFNAAIVGVTIAFAPQIGIRAAALGWLIGAFAQFALQLPGLRGSRLRFTLDWNHPGLRQIALLYAPVLFSLLIDTLVIRLLSYRLANSVGEGSISYMNWATTLIQFPHGLVATAISIAILPTLSRQAASVVRGVASDAAAFKDTLGLGLRLAIVLILPATVGLFVLGTPIVDLLFEHGAFTAEDTTITVIALRLYLLGLPFAALDLLLIYAFYAQQDTFTPAVIGLLSLTLYMVVALALMPTTGLYSLMIADSVKHLVHACVSGYLLTRRLNGLGNQRLITTALRASAAALVMGLVGWWVLPPLASLAGGSLLGEIGLVMLSGSICGVAFVGMALLLQLEELRWLAGSVLRRVGLR
ncbi:MAG: murein biosynthesis integral membrane protein MurJ [Chloroflexota bacterium]